MVLCRSGLGTQWSGYRNQSMEKWLPKFPTNSEFFLPRSWMMVPNMHGTIITSTPKEPILYVFFTNFAFNDWSWFYFRSSDVMCSVSVLYSTKIPRIPHIKCQGMSKVRIQKGDVQPFNKPHAGHWHPLEPPMERVRATSTHCDAGGRWDLGATFGAADKKRGWHERCANGIITAVNGSSFTCKKEK